MASKEDYLNFLKDQLSGIGEFETKKMFGGHGFFKDGLMFGMLGSGIFRLKVDESNEQDYIDKGMKPYYSDKKKKGMPYWEVPADVLENRTELSKWALKSVSIAIKSSSEK
ncbi:MAG: TfoX/Sxy family protein [Cyclobacteriaceae bacterium]